MASSRGCGSVSVRFVRFYIYGLHCDVCVCVCTLKNNMSDTMAASLAGHTMVNEDNLLLHDVSKRLPLPTGLIHSLCDFHRFTTDRLSIRPSVQLQID